MDIEKRYDDIIKRNASSSPKVSYEMIKVGLLFEKFIVNHTKEKIPDAYKELNLFAVESMRKSLKNPEKTCWVNLFSPVEILQCFDINPLSIECFSSFISGFQCEDFFNDCAEKSGISETLCSYHKGFIGAVEAGVLPAASFAMTTSMCCDANINTIRYVCKKKNVDSYIIDVPYSYSKENEIYVVEQLKELIGILEKKFNKKFDYSRLKEILKRENESKKYFLEYARMQRDRYYPSTLTLHMYMLFASHLSIGTKETYNFYKHLAEDIKNYPDSDGIKILWVHLLPYYHKVLKEYFNCKDDYQIQTYDMNFDYIDMLDTDKPLESLAKKMILNIYNGPYENKIKRIDEMIDMLHPDGVINFCQWGCRQSSGGAQQLKNHISKRGLPMLVIDGDGMDRRNAQEGQIKTRMEAFLEVIRNFKESESLC